MTLIKKVFKILAITTLFSASSVFASDFLVNTTIDDAIGDAAGGWKYEVEKMNVQWTSDDNITVDIYTNFVDYNNTYSTGRRSGDIVLGDLLISTNGEDSPFNYAFVLSDNDRYNDDYSSQNHWDGQGTFTEISSTTTAKEFHNDSNQVQVGEVMADDTVGVGQESDWSIDRQNTGTNYDQYDIISFSFNVNGIDAFQNASQLAFSWAMSCANDIVEGVVNIDRTSAIPEPATMLLLLTALGFMANSRKTKAKSFSA